MTTTVTIKTHDWPAEVSDFPLIDREPVAGEEWSEGTRVEPHSERQFVVTDTNDLLVKELARDPETQEPEAPG